MKSNWKKTVAATGGRRKGVAEGAGGCGSRREDCFKAWEWRPWARRVCSSGVFARLQMPVLGGTWSGLGRWDAQCLSGKSVIAILNTLSI